jgi:DNA topoisomerase-1
MKVSALKALTVTEQPAALPRELRLAAHKNALPGPKAFAEATGLRWVTDAAPGIRRVRAGKGFRFVSPTGKTVTDPATLRRVQSLVIPPAWKDVWVCPSPDGHIQATGVDDRGRKQYRYHPRWRATRDQTKFDRMIAFGKALPHIRRATDRDLRHHGLPKEKVLAAIVQLLEKTLIRVGNEEYAKSNRHYGLTTIRDEHATVRGGTVTFRFKGKSGVAHELELEDPRLAKIVKACQDLPDQELFAYRRDDGAWADVTSSDVNAYLKQIAGQDFTAKDFRTWAGTVLAAQALQEFAAFDSQAQAKKNVVRAVEAVAKRLGNTKAVCRKCYIHPAVLDCYLDGSLVQTLEQRARAALKRVAHFRPEEAAVLAFLQERLRRQGRHHGARRVA